MRGTREHGHKRWNNSTQWNEWWKQFPQTCPRNLDGTWLLKLIHSFGETRDAAGGRWDRLERASGTCLPRCSEPWRPACSSPDRASLSTTTWDVSITAQYYPQCTISTVGSRHRAVHPLSVWRRASIPCLCWLAREVPVILRSRVNLTPDEVSQLCPSLELAAWPFAQFCSWKNTQTDLHIPEGMEGKDGA